MINAEKQKYTYGVDKEKVTKSRIGILTFQDAENFGAVLQAYALKEFVKQLNIGSVEIINYIKPYLIERFKIFKIYRSDTVSFIKSLSDNILFFPHRYLSKNKYRKFRDKYMDISAKKYLNPNEITGYDTYIVGSDQVWNNELNNDDETFFLGFCVENEKKIAYGASLGNHEIDDKQLTWLEKHINNIDYISVREDNAVETLTPLTDKEVVHVLDPVLLAERELWDRLIKNIKLQTPYLLIYRIFANDEVYEVANTIAKQLHLQVVYIHICCHLSTSIDYSDKPNKYGFKNVRCAGPREFLTLLKNANFVVTNSFHGTAFSIVFNKDFVVIPPKRRWTRITSLVNMLKLNERIITNHNQVLNNFNFEVDYTIANEILKKEKEKSLNFLKNALEN